MFKEILILIMKSDIFIRQVYTELHYVRTYIHIVKLCNRDVIKKTDGRKEIQIYCSTLLYNQVNYFIDRPQSLVYCRVFFRGQKLHGMVAAICENFPP